MDSSGPQSQSRRKLLKGVETFWIRVFMDTVHKGDFQAFRVQRRRLIDVYKRQLLGPIAVAAYSYMALVPIIQPPIMKLLTTKKERAVVMEQLRPVSKLEKILFPIIVTIVVALLLPDAVPLVGMLMLGNIFRESGVVSRISNTAQNELMNIITIFLGVTVGATATGEVFLSPSTLLIIVLGLLDVYKRQRNGFPYGRHGNCRTSGADRAERKPP